MENVWEISKSQKELLDSLFGKIEGDVGSVLDLGSGRTSLYYLTERYKNLTVKAIVYPGDTRKINPIKECVKNTNYEIIESDIKDFDFGQKYDLVLAHLFLGEAEKFAGNKFEEVLNSIFQIKTKYLVMVNLFRDNINYNLLLKKIGELGSIEKASYAKSEDGDECLGLLIKFN